MADLGRGQRRRLVGAGCPGLSLTSVGHGSSCQGYRRRRGATWGEVTADGRSGFPAAAGRYHLYACLACPWSHRVVLGRLLKGLESAISISYADPYRDARGWALTGGDFVEEVNGFSFLAEAYAATDPTFDDRVTLPVLWDTSRGEIVNNESGDILRMLGDAFGAFAEHDVDLYPPALRREIDTVNEHVYENLNDAVYQAGFSRNQAAYEEACARVFATLDGLEERLASTRYLVADTPTEADLRLFPTLVRFDTVYYLHFKCNRRQLVDPDHPRRPGSRLSGAARPRLSFLIPLVRRDARKSVLRDQQRLNERLESSVS